MPGWDSQAPGKPGSSRRLAWLEAEYARLGFECQYLESVNNKLSRQLNGVESDDDSDEGEGQANDAISPDQIEIETEDGTKPTNKRQSLHRKVSIHSNRSFDSDTGVQVSGHRMRVTYRADNENDDPTRTESVTSGLTQARSMMEWMGTYTNAAVMRGSALGKSKPVQVAIYLLAFLFVIFVLVATALELGAPDHADGGGHGDGHGADASGHDAAAAAGGHGDTGGHHRLLSGGGGAHLLKNIAFSLVGAGMVAYIIHILKLPLIIGYLLGGMLVGPVGLGIVTGYDEIDEVAELGLLFLLFMIGMELDFHKLMKMDRMVVVTGIFQFPICAGATYLVFLLLHDIFGLSLGTGDHAITYISLTCSVSSTMIVTRMLAEKFETESHAGQLSNAILVCQDVWAIVILAVQPTVNSPDLWQILRNFIMITILIVAALAYAKFVMPPVLLHASKSVELMLVLALSWCFFVCSAAVLPFVGLSMELAAIIAGCALATFPYSQDFNSKIKFIRDFFITLFFAGIGMNVPVPTAGVVGKAFLVVAVVLVIRWLGIFALHVAVGGEPRWAALTTINLSQISEFAIVICSMGVFEGGGFGHITGELMAITVWAFAIMAVISPWAIIHSHQIVRCQASIMKRVVPLFRGRASDVPELTEDEEAELYEEEQRDIVLLGFHKIAAMLIAEFQIRSPELLKRVHVVDINPGAMSSLREKGIKCSWGDFASAKELACCHKGEVHVMISSIPDSLLQGVTNMKLLKVAKSVWPDAHFIATADNPFQAHDLYEAGADYVVRMAKMCAERLHELLTEHCTHTFGSGELNELFEQYKTRDRDAKGRRGFLALKA